MKNPLLLCVASLFLTSCAGYQLGSPRPRAMEGIQTLAVPNFENKTLEPRIEVLVTDTVIQQLQQDGTFRIVGEKEADAVIRGKIVSLNRYKARSLRRNTLASSEFTLELKVEYTVTKRSTGEEVLRRDVSGSTTFFISQDLNQDERQAIPLAAAKLAVEMTSQLSEGW